MRMTKKEKDQWEQWQLSCKRIQETTVISQKKETAAEKKKRITMLLKPENWQKFVVYYFATEDFKPAPMGWFHEEAINNVFVQKLRKHAWEWHRESAKSVFADIFIPIHMLIDGSLDGMILSSENEDKAKNLIKDVEAQLRNNQRLIADFGDFGISGTWMSSFFQTKKGIGFWAFGLGQNPAGVRNGFKRPNLGIVDDGDNKDKAKNQKLTIERVNWIKGEFMGCLAKDNRTFIYLNNRVHNEGITAHIVGDLKEGDEKDSSFAHIKVYLTEDPKTHLPIYPEGRTEEAIMADLIQKGAVPAWKEYYSLADAAAKIVDYGVSNALRQLYHKHIIDGDLFDDDNMPWVDPLPLSSYDGLVSYCDPAFGESGKGCFKCVVLMGKTGHYYDILWVWLRQSGNWIDAHRQLATNMKKLVCIPGAKKEGKEMQIQTKHWVEANPLQKPHLKKSYLIENLNYDEAWFPRYDDRNKGDKFGRIEALETPANNLLLRFNSNLKKDKDMIVLRDQFKGFPSGMIDGPDTVEGGKNKLDKIKKKGSKKRRGGKYKKKTNRF